MSNPPPQTPVADAWENDAGTQLKIDLLEERLESIDLSDLPSGTGSQEQRRKKPSAELPVYLSSDTIDEEKFLRTFANELQLLDTLDHPNIIKLVGFVEDMKQCIAWFVFPWEANGNVREFLLSGKWELPERVSLLNILVNSEHRAVITDFGSARIQNQGRGFNITNRSPRRQAALTDPNVTPSDGCPEATVSATTGELTLTGPSWSFRWAAPEILNEEEPCLASDIWALGWIAWESVPFLLDQIVTDNYPFPEAKTNKSITINVVMGRLPQLYDDGQLSQIGQLCYLMD
ncbi:Ephrin type-A receptor 8 [Tulasnella sp. 408]|nr:Ephrin type-A receptor 8 [Tulasnella sp. 408]